tara:strand:- start:710 stop:1156 length:447 start_codon:yes stop_codon:yes gene_type:complete
MIRNKGKNMIEITTDTEGIYMRDYQDTLVTREIPNNYGYYNDAGEYVENGTFTITHYRYAHNPMELYEANANQPNLNLENYTNDNYNEVALYKGIPMRFRYNPVIRNIMKTGGFRIRYRGCSKPQYGYVRSQRNCLAEYADTFAIYPK